MIAETSLQAMQVEWMGVQKKKNIRKTIYKFG